MKKRLSLEKLSVNSFKTTYQKAVKGGNQTIDFCTEGYQCPTYTYNEWCWTDENTVGAFCTAPK
ncbi:hypothetical protein AB9P05_22450 [Roseivirga sp. BDSF3-8]|uniref:hypothetical protein n=1 Tax=Roseivirga sp. BDSF3-8 TaxID=3241598 RepID=UPI0035323B2D